MPRLAADTSFRALALDSSAESPLHRQLYDEIRLAILSGRLVPGARLPASRDLARLVTVSRNTVLTAYEQLSAEGYLESRVGAGTFVARDIPETSLAQAPAERRAPPSGAPRRIARRAQAACASSVGTHRPHPAREVLRPGMPALAHFPMDIWRRLTDRHLRAASVRMLSYDEPQGHRPLREAIAAHLAASRGARLDADQVLIVSGAQQAVDLVARALTDPGDEVWFEDPGYTAARSAFAAHGARLVPVPVDAEGLIVDRGLERAPHARLAYVTPSHQNPLGVRLTLSRRVALSQWAERAGAWILEDDNASEYRYGGRPIAALQGIDPYDRVLYAGTFSKVLFASLRLGYLVAPRDLVPLLVRARELADRQSAALPQYVLADFMREGHFGRHVRRMRTLYAERLEALLAAVARHGDGLLSTERGLGGMSRVLWLPPGVSDEALIPDLRAASLQCMPLSNYRMQPSDPGGLVCGFTSIEPSALDHAIATLAGIVRRHADAVGR